MDEATPKLPSPEPGEPSSANGDPNGTPTIGEPDTLPLTFCRKCQVEVKPEGKGRCPRCQTFLRLNFSARKHPINKLRREQLLDKLIADYHPDTTVLQAKCEHLAGILEQLEVLKAGSQEHKRLVELSEQLGAALEATRPPIRPSDITVIRRIIVDPRKESEALEARALKLAEMARSIHLGPLGEPDLPPAADAGPSSETTVTPAGEAAQPAPTWAPEPCPYCHQSPCVGRGHVAYETLHWDDPEEVKKRDEYATAVMMKQLGKPSPWL